MQQAEIYGYRANNSNPFKGIARYKRPPKERFLSADELAAIGGVLENYRSKAPLVVSLKELMILTGCQKGEASGLQWTNHRHGNLYLPDSKTGPKTIYLSSAARAVLAATPRTSPYVFPRIRGKGEAGFCIVLIIIGEPSVDNPGWQGCGCMTFATLAPASPLSTASILSPSGDCSDTVTRKPPSNIPISPTTISKTRRGPCPRLSPKCCKGECDHETQTETH